MSFLNDWTSFCSSSLMFSVSCCCSRYCACMRLVSSLTAKVGAYADGANATTSGRWLPFPCLFRRSIGHYIFAVRWSSLRDSIEYAFPVEIVLVVSSLIRLPATADCFVRVWCSYTSYQHFISRRLSWYFWFFSQAKVPEICSKKIQSEETKSEEKRYPAWKA